MRLSRANIPLASENRTHSQAISPSPHYNLAPHFWPGFINLQHFCHSRWRNPVRLSKSGVTVNCCVTARRASLPVGFRKKDCLQKIVKNIRLERPPLCLSPKGDSKKTGPHLRPG